jgi:hypothetical protein
MIRNKNIRFKKAITQPVMAFFLTLFNELLKSCERFCDVSFFLKNFNI